MEQEICCSLEKLMDREKMSTQKRCDHFISLTNKKTELLLQSATLQLGFLVSDLHLAIASVFLWRIPFAAEFEMLITRMGGATMMLPIQASSTIPLSTVRIGSTFQTRAIARLGFGGSARIGFVVCCSKGGDNAESASSWGDGGEVSRLRRENSELRASLAELSQSLASISSALAEVSRAVQLVANAVDCGNSSSSAENGVLGVAAATTSPTQEIAADAPPERQDPPTPFPSIEDSELEAIQDPVQAQLMEQNRKAHNLAYRLQQAFFQARIEGLGKPFQLAAEDFVTTCLEAHAIGIGLRELQLQLILLEGSLTGAFAIQNQRHLDAPVMSEESRVRSSWVRLVYTTLAEVKERRSRVEHTAADAGKEREQPDPSDAFVKELVTLAFEKGYDLERVKLEQSVSGPVTSTAIKTMRQCTYLVLLTLQKITNDALEKSCDIDHGGHVVIVVVPRVHMERKALPMVCTLMEAIKVSTWKTKAHVQFVSEK